MVKFDGVIEKSSKEMAMPIRNLPVDVIEDILSRLPVKSLLRFRCVSKLWCARINDPDFVKMHLSRSLASNSNLTLVFNDSPYLYSVDLDACEQEAAVELDYPFESPQYNAKIEIYGSCNGILCIHNSDDNGILLWNPSIRRHQELPVTPPEFPGRSCIRCPIVVYGLGYDPTTDDYKLVRVVQLYGDDDYHCDSEVKVYSLSTNSWRRVRDMPFCLCHEKENGVLANSALHWLAKRKMGPDTISRFIISFDLKDEEYREVPMPYSVDDTNGALHMNVTVLGEQLCMVCDLFPYCLEVWDLWVMVEYGVRDSWAKLLSIELPPGVRTFDYLTPICYSKNGEVILEKDSEMLILYNPHTKSHRELRIRGVPDDIDTEAYVGSLIPLNAKDGTEQAKRKKEAEGEKEQGSRGLASDVEGWK